MMNDDNDDDDDDGDGDDDDDDDDDDHDDDDHDDHDDDSNCILLQTGWSFRSQVQWERSANYNQIQP